MKQQNSAIIAGCGYVGWRVAAIWKNRGLQVHAITRSESKAEQLRNAGIIPILLDLAATAPMQPLPDADIILWSVGFDRSPGTSRKALWLDGLTRLLEALPQRLEPRRTIYISSTSVYGDGHGQIVDENTAPNPASEGGVACLAAERLLQDYSKRTAACISILRLAGIYGPNRLLRKIGDLKSGVPITSPPDEWLNLIHVDDAVTAIDSLSQVEAPPSLMNIVASQSVTRRQYYSLLAVLANSPSPVFAEPIDAQAPRRGGNRRVISVVRNSLPFEFKYDSINDGLPAAFT